MTRPISMNDGRSFAERIVETGRLAFRAGVDRKTRTLAKGSEAERLWLAGWDDAANRKGGDA
jgi:hypothetical protein